MGQKTNPKAFRLVTNQSHLSNWYGNKKNYARHALQDANIRLKIEKGLKNFLPLSEITISRNFARSQDFAQILIISVTALFPNVQDMLRKFGTFIPKNVIAENTFEPAEEMAEFAWQLASYCIKKEIRDIVRTLADCDKKIYKVGINFLKNRFEDPKLIARFIAEQLEQRVPFRRTMKQVIKEVQQTTLKGIKIEISGRLNGTDIARSEWKIDGQIPLHTLDAKIDYTHYAVETVYGILGVKVWLTR